MKKTSQRILLIALLGILLYSAVYISNANSSESKSQRFNKL